MVEEVTVRVQEKGDTNESRLVEVTAPRLGQKQLALSTFRRMFVLKCSVLITIHPLLCTQYSGLRAHKSWLAIRG